MCVVLCGILPTLEIAFHLVMGMICMYVTFPLIATNQHEALKD